MIRIPEYLERRRPPARRRPSSAGARAAATVTRAGAARPASPMTGRCASSSPPIRSRARSPRSRSRARSPTAGRGPGRTTRSRSARWPTAAKARSRRSPRPAAGPGRRRRVDDPLGRPSRRAGCARADGRRAVVEMAEASGPVARRGRASAIPSRATSIGTGELLADRDRRRGHARSCSGSAAARRPTAAPGCSGARGATADRDRADGRPRRPRRRGSPSVDWRSPAT